MKKLLFLLLALTVSAPAFAQTQTQYYTVPTIAALKAMTTSRPAVVQVVDANPGIFNLSAGACAAADDVFQVQPTSGTTVCYTRAATPYAVGTAGPLTITSSTYGGGYNFNSQTSPTLIQPWASVNSAMRWADNLPDVFTLAIQKKTATSAFPGLHTETGAILGWSECSGDGSAFLKDCVGADFRGTIAVPAVLNTFTASIATTVLTVTAVATGTIEINDIISCSGCTANTRVVSLGTGTGGTGTYNVSVSQTVSSRAMEALQRGSAWGGVSIATANPGTSGTLMSWEFDTVNNGCCDQPLVDTTTSTYGIAIFAGGTNPVTAAIRAASTSNKFHHGLWMSAADIVGVAGDSFLHYDDSFGACLFCVSYTGGLTGQAATFAGTVTSTVAGPSFTASNVSTPYYRATDGTRQAHFGVDSANPTNSGFALSNNGFRLLTNNGSTTALTATSAGALSFVGTVSAQNAIVPSGFTTPAFDFNDLGTTGLTSADANTHPAMTVTGNSSGAGTGSWLGAYIKQLGGAGSTSGSYLTGVYGEARASSVATAGNYTGLGSWCGLEAGASVTSCVGAEINVFSLGAGGTTPTRQIMRLFDTSTGPTAGLGTINSVLRMGKTSAASPYADAISINADVPGTDSGFPVAAGGTLLTASTTSLQLASAIQLSGMAGGFSVAAIILPQGGTGSSIFFGAAGTGGQIISQATSNPGKLLFASNSMTMQFGSFNSILATSTGVSLSGLVNLGSDLANYFTVAGAASAFPIILPAGSSADINAVYSTKGSGCHYHATNGGGGATVLTTCASLVTLAQPLNYGGVTLSNSVTGTGSMVLSANPTFTGTVGAAAITATGAVTSNAAGPSFVASNVSTPYYRATDGTRQAHFGVDSTDATNSGFALSGNGFRILTNNGLTTALTLTAAGAATVSGTLSATIASTAQTNVACYNSGTGLFTYQTWATGCLASSARFKENISAKSNADALKVVTSLEPVTFNYKKSADMGSDKHNGFIAEQVVKVAPDLVVFEKDGKTPRAVKYQELAPYFAGAIRELKTANDNLKAEIEQLKKRVK